MRTLFDAKLEALNEQLINMGALCEDAIEKAVLALGDHNVDLAAQVAGSDTVIDRKEREIEALCMSLILHQQPIARDLRFIGAALKMITDMERIADQAADIAGIIPSLNFNDVGSLTLIKTMGGAAAKMVKRSIDAYVKQDESLAESIFSMDDEVDAYFIKVKEDLIYKIKTHEDKAQTALNLFMIAKYLERIGDHACNIAEWVKYALTGKHELYDPLGE